MILCPAACSPRQEADPPKEESKQPRTRQSPSTQPATIQALKTEEIEVAKRLMADYPNSPNAVALLGMVHEADGNTTEAMKCWRRCLELNPRLPDVYNGMGWVAYRGGQHDKAVTLWRKALELAPNFPGVHNRLGRVLMDLGKSGDAIAMLDKGIRIFPKDSQSRYLLGQAYLQLSEYAKAKICYEQAIALQDNHQQAHYGLAAVCVQMGQGDKARQHMTRFENLKARADEMTVDRETGHTDLLEVRGSLARTHTDAGVVHSTFGNAAKAEEHWRKAAYLDPKNTICRMRLAALYRSTARQHEALVMCEQLREIDPKNPVTHLNISILHLELKQFDAALSAIERARALAPTSVRIRQMYETIKNRK